MSAIPPTPIFVSVTEDGQVTPMGREWLMQVTPEHAAELAERIGWPLEDVRALLWLDLGATVITNFRRPTPLTDWARQQGRVRHIGDGIRELGLPRSVWRTPFPGDPDAYSRYLVNDRPDLAARIGELRNTVLACDCELPAEQCHAYRIAALADLRLATELRWVRLPVGTELDVFLAEE